MDPTEAAKQWQATLASLDWTAFRERMYERGIVTRPEDLPAYSEA